jgi:hypothetical protein
MHTLSEWVPTLLLKVPCMELCILFPLKQIKALFLVSTTSIGVVAIQGANAIVQLQVVVGTIAVK